jgi:hypothetical protein
LASVPLDGEITAAAIVCNTAVAIDMVRITAI